MARCPYSPQHNSTALLTAGGELYAATAMDFPGRDPAIYRSLGILPPLRTAQYNSKWLNGKSGHRPTFPSLLSGFRVLTSQLPQFLKHKAPMYSFSKEIKMSLVLYLGMDWHHIDSLPIRQKQDVLNAVGLIVTWTFTD